MNNKQNKQQEVDDNKYNKAYSIHAMALEILRQCDLWTMSEALQEAEYRYNNGLRPDTNSHIFDV